MAIYYTASGVDLFHFKTSLMTETMLEIDVSVKHDRASNTKMVDLGHIK
jgi:hypothetical protein